MHSTDETQAGKGPEHPVIVAAVRTVQVLEEENGWESYVEQKTEYVWAAVHSAFSAKASNTFVELNHRPPLFALKYLHCLPFIHPFTWPLVIQLFTIFVRSTPELKSLMQRGMWRRHFLLIYGYPTNMLTTALSAFPQASESCQHQE